MKLQEGTVCEIMDDSHTRIERKKSKPKVLTQQKWFD
jgi:hypothetical protein